MDDNTPVEWEGPDVTEDEAMAASTAASDGGGGGSFPLSIKLTPRGSNFKPARLEGSKARTSRRRRSLGGYGASSVACRT